MEIKVFIDQTGEPTIEVSGVKGKTCKDLTKDLEKALGKTVSETKTREFYESERTNVRNQQRR